MLDIIVLDRDQPNKRVYSTGIKKHAFQTACSCFRSTEGNRFGSKSLGNTIRLKEPRESCLVLEDFHHGLIQRKLDRASDQRQDQQPGSTDRSADFGQGFGQAWRAVARAAGIFFYFHNKGKGRTCVKLMPEDQGSVGNYERRLLPKSFFEARTVEVSPYSKKLK